MTTFSIHTEEMDEKTTKEFIQDLQNICVIYANRHGIDIDVEIQVDIIQASPGYETDKTLDGIIL